MAGNPDVSTLIEEMLDSGRTPEEVCRDCPELLPEVRRRWSAFRLVDGALAALFPGPETQPGADPIVAVSHPAELPQVPGYRVEAVLGRGGMGVVYRAWHLRLNRAVALKMLLAGPCALPVELERFLREAQAVAGLRHPNVVQVYDVGDVEGRPFFTMELVEGGSLAERVQGVPQPARQAAALVATLAEAVHAAHQGGIVHRDLKPGNVLLTADGTPKVTDFGLARRLEGGNGGLTLSGLPLGTPSYMAPEQARGKKGAIGPATDIYALGAILYELLTGRPPFRAETATATLLQVVADEPVPPARLNPQVPRDLTTICLKCLHKEPPKRYASAAALAEDLHRFLRGETIAARPAGWLERLARWTRRRPAAAALLTVTVLMATAVLGGAGWLIVRQLGTARAVEADLREAERWQQQSAFREAGAALGRARSRLGDSGPFWLYPVAEAARRDQEFLVRLEAIRVNRFTLAEGGQTHVAQMRFNKARADRDYAEAFRGQGLGEPPDDPEGAAARVRASKWAAHLVAALDDWAVCAVDPARQDWVLAVARRAGPGPWRDRVRDPAVWRDGKALAELARAAPLAEQPIPLLLALGERLSATGEDGVGFLRRVREQHPEDFWANLTLALALHGAGRQRRGDPEPALVYYQKALEIRPHAVAVLNDLGVALMDKGWMWDKERDGGPGAFNVFYQVVKSDARFAPGFNNLGLALKGRGYWPIAALLYQDAVGIDPRLAPAHFTLGEVLAGSGNLGEAIDHYRQALGADPDFARAHYDLGVALLAKGRRDEVDEDYPEGVEPLAQFRGPALGEALAYYRQIQDCDPASWAPARRPLHISPQDEARLKEAIDHFRQAVRLGPQFALAHGALGQALLARRELTEAEAETRLALDLVPKGEIDLRANLEGQLLRCQYLRALEGRVSAVVQGTDKPATGDCLDLAELCFVKNHFATAARLYARALAGTPHWAEDLRAGHRLNVARAAALAGDGQGDDVAGFGEPEREALRKQAREWLRLDLAAWGKKVDTGTEADRIQARRTLAPWRDDPDLAGLRDPDTLKRLPPAEREECRALWQEVADTLRRAQTTR
jgi:eukaryotic-like serine/threonine-protein kinase